MNKQSNQTSSNIQSSGPVNNHLQSVKLNNNDEENVDEDSATSFVSELKTPIASNGNQNNQYVTPT